MVTWKSVDEEGGGEGEVAGEDGEGAVHPGGGVPLEGVVGWHLDDPGAATPFLVTKGRSNTTKMHITEK